MGRPLVYGLFLLLCASTLMLCTGAPVVAAKMRAKGNADTGLRMAMVLAASKEKPAMPQPNIKDKIHEGVDNTIKGVHKLSKDAVDEAGREANMIGGALSNG